MKPQTMMTIFGIDQTTRGARLFLKVTYLCGLTGLRMEEVMEEVRDVEGLTMDEMRVLMASAVAPVLRAPAAELRRLRLPLLRRTLPALVGTLADELRTGVSTEYTFDKWIALRDSVNGSNEKSAVDSFGKSTGSGSEAGQGPGLRSVWECPLEDDLPEVMA